MCPTDGYVIIKDSELLSGNLGKTIMGSGNKNGLFYRLARDNTQVINNTNINTINIFFFNNMKEKKNFQ